MINTQLPVEVKLKDVCKIGDIFYSSWGYEQTNIDFYMVTKVHNSMVDIVHIESKIADEQKDNTNYTTVLVKPYPVIPGNAKVMRKKVTISLIETKDNTKVDLGIRISSFQWGSKWDGRPLAETHSYYGH